MADFISRDEVLETIRYRVCQGHGNKEHICKRGSCAYCGIMEIMSDISSIEDADVQPVKHGKWLSRCEGDIYEFSECSECGNTESCETPYCAQCGAIMDKS